MVVVVTQELARVPISILQLIGDLNDEEPLTTQAQHLFANGSRHMLLDLNEVPYISSAGLRAIHAIYTLLSSETSADDKKSVHTGIAAGTYSSPHLKLLSPSKHSLKALQVAGYDMFLDIHHNRKEAVASF